ncbi:hypothetical protein CLOM_g6301 [Closterium sp. NIES-68]|nr:hypothetical protein CLOM_g3215 [Closterium sp. NIES-68]GJP47068.1 hypothetical protein CLOM_g6301 [Closterium sp. NIES-68]GJP76361.1 hypothetical protein CLOP_g6817 [Closterium sp. NIES-67]
MGVQTLVQLSSLASSTSQVTSLQTRCRHAPVSSYVCRRAVSIRASAQSPKGFGTKPVKPATPPKQTEPAKQLEETPAKTVREDIDDEVPEVVTNRILKRLAFTVGVPLFVGLSFFPLFYYLKVIQKVDVPDWLPLLTSLFLFGGAGLGISYGVISTSWDPLREGSLLGWTEFKANWPVFMQTMGKDKK